MGEYYSWKSASIATTQHMVGVFTIEQAPSPLPALYATDIRPKEEVISFPFDIPPRYHHLLVFLARLCRLQTLSKWLFQILVALFLFQLQKAYFPRSKFHALFLTLRFPSFSSFLIPPLKGLFLLFLISSSNTKKGRFLLGFSSLNSLKRWFLYLIYSSKSMKGWFHLSCRVAGRERQTLEIQYSEPAPASTSTFNLQMIQLSLPGLSLFSISTFNTQFQYWQYSWH